jgi:hypothetical protein
MDYTMNSVTGAGFGSPRFRLRSYRLSVFRLYSKLDRTELSATGQPAAAMNFIRIAQL